MQKKIPSKKILTIIEYFVIDANTITQNNRNYSTVRKTDKNVLQAN